MRLWILLLACSEVPAVAPTGDAQSLRRAFGDRSALMQLIESDPDGDAAARALRWLAARRRQEDGAHAERDFWLGAASWLQALGAGPRVRAEAWVQAGRLATGRAALHCYEQALAVGGGTVWRDDAQFGAAQASLSVGDKARARYLLQVLVDEGERSGDARDDSVYRRDARRLLQVL
jgi:hypothetical protein